MKIRRIVLYKDQWVIMSLDRIRISGSNLLGNNSINNIRREFIIEINKTAFKEEWNGLRKNN